MRKYEDMTRDELIKELKVMEEALRKSEEKFAIIAKQMSFTGTPEGKIIFKQDDEKIFDRENLLIRFDYDEELVKDVVETFLKNAPVLIENLKQAFRQGDFDKIKYFSHGLKGASATVSANLVSLKASQIEKLSEQGRPEVIARLIKVLEYEKDRFKKNYLELCNSYQVVDSPL